MRALRVGLLVSFEMCLTAGCVVPIPMWGPTGTFKGVSAESIRFIQVGSTTRDDVLLNLGIPSAGTADQLEYFIEEYGMGWGIGIPWGGGDVLTVKKQKVLRLTFNEAAIVTNCSFVNRSTSRRGLLFVRPSSRSLDPEPCER